MRGSAPPNKRSAARRPPGHASVRCRQTSVSLCRIASIAPCASSRKCAAAPPRVPDARVRHAIYKTFSEGGIPRSEMLSHQLRMTVAEVRTAMERLHAAHAIVLESRASRHSAPE